MVRVVSTIHSELQCVDCSARAFVTSNRGSGLAVPPPGHKFGHNGARAGSGCTWRMYQMWCSRRDSLYVTRPWAATSKLGSSGCRQEGQTQRGTASPHPLLLVTNAHTLQLLLLQLLLLQ